MLVIWLLVLLLGVTYLAHSRTAALPALGITAAYLVAMALFSPVPGWLQLLLWIVTGAGPCRTTKSALRSTHSPWCTSWRTTVTSNGALMSDCVP